MAYSNNPRLPKIRRDAVRMLSRGHSVRTVARHFGFSPGAISKWAQKAKRIGDHPIPTRSSRPHYQPTRIPEAIRNTVAEKRILLKRAPEVVHHELRKEGVDISVSSVYRILSEKYLIKKRSPWKRLHAGTPRPAVEKPGDLVEIDTIHVTTRQKTKIYVYTLIDVWSRYAYARAYGRASTRQSIDFLRRARKALPFHIRILQSDNGSEFSVHFTERIGVVHRHTRVRSPNDNGHLERFNRTVQEECLARIPADVAKLNRAISKYLPYYNKERHHFALQFRTPNARILEA